MNDYLRYYGDDQAFYLHDSTAENYIYGRQPMSSTVAWVLHGCFKGNASYQYYQIPFDKVRKGCNDVTQTYDHFDVTSSHYTLLKQMHEIRSIYPVLNDGLSAKTITKSTKLSYVSTTDYVTNYSISLYLIRIAIKGVWSVSRSYLDSQIRPANLLTDAVWLIFSNLDYEWKSTCKAKEEIRSLYPSGTSIRNIFPPNEIYIVGQDGCIDGIVLPPFGFKAFVKSEEWFQTSPTLLAFKPGISYFSSKNRT